jgi:hypothetical protein
MTFIVSKTMMLLGSLFLIFGSSTVSLIGAVLALGLATHGSVGYPRTFRRRPFFRIRNPSIPEFTAT